MSNLKRKRTVKESTRKRVKMEEVDENLPVTTARHIMNFEGKLIPNIALKPIQRARVVECLSFPEPNIAHVLDAHSLSETQAILLQSLSEILDPHPAVPFPPLFSIDLYRKFKLQYLLLQVPSLPSSCDFEPGNPHALALSLLKLNARIFEFDEFFIYA